MGKLIPDPFNTNPTALWMFAREFVGNLKPGNLGMTIAELKELTIQYPEIWGEYVKAYTETKGQGNNTGVPEELGRDVQEQEAGVGSQSIEPSIGWWTSEIGCDTSGENL